MPIHPYQRSVLINNSQCSASLASAHVSRAPINNSRSKLIINNLEANIGNPSFTLSAIAKRGVILRNIPYR